MADGSIIIDTRIDTAWCVERNERCEGWNDQNIRTGIEDG